MAHEILALEVLTLLLENPTDDSVEVAVNFLKECGSKLTEVSQRGVFGECLCYSSYDSHYIPNIDLIIVSYLITI